jgi:rhodanese-related sulfurtransferase
MGMARISAFLAALIVAMGLAVADGESQTAKAFETIDAGTLQALLDRGVTVVDIRTPEEWRATGVIAGSKRITAFAPDGRFNPQFASEFQSLVQPGDEVALICRTGNRTRVLSEALSRQAGYTRVYNVDGGIVRWLADGRAVAPCANC